MNKLVVLKMAAEFGLQIPVTTLTTKKTSLTDFLKKSNKVITKSTSGENMIRDRRITANFTNYTEVVPKSFVKSLGEKFFISQFQQLVEKEYEVRAFYLDRRFYSMAIFSQGDNQTKIEFRKYNREKPNRTVPYKLPSDVEEKLRNLMEALELESGSIDLIAKDGQYIFLEVNPVGQFGMVSVPCNYYLEKRIAEYLTYTK